MVKSDHVIAGSEFILNHIHSNYDIKATSRLLNEGLMKSFFQKKCKRRRSNKTKKSMNITENKFIILLPETNVLERTKAIYRGFKYINKKLT